MLGVLIPLNVKIIKITRRIAIRAITTITTVAIIITTIIITSLVIKEEEVPQEEGIISIKVEDDLIKILNILKGMTKVKIIIQAERKIPLRNKRPMLC